MLFRAGGPPQSRPEESLPKRTSFQPYCRDLNNYKYYGSICSV